MVAGRQRDRLLERPRRHVASGHEPRRLGRAPDPLAARELELLLLPRLVARGRQRQRAARRRAARRLRPGEPRPRDVSREGVLVSRRHTRHVHGAERDAERGRRARRPHRRQRHAPRRDGLLSDLGPDGQPDRVRRRRVRQERAPRRGRRRHRRHPACERRRRLRAELVVERAVAGDDPPGPRGARLDPRGGRRRREPPRRVPRDAERLRLVAERGRARVLERDRDLDRRRQGRPQAPGRADGLPGGVVARRGAARVHGRRRVPEPERHLPRRRRAAAAGPGHERLPHRRHGGGRRPDGHEPRGRAPRRGRQRHARGRAELLQRA